MKGFNFCLLVSISVFLLNNVPTCLTHAYPIESEDSERSYGYFLYDQNGNKFFSMAIDQQMGKDATLIIDIDETYYINAFAKGASAASFQTDYPDPFDDTPVSGFEIQENTFVPEPATMLLVGLGLKCMAVFMRESSLKGETGFKKYLNGREDIMLEIIHSALGENPGGHSA